MRPYDADIAAVLSANPTPGMVLTPAQMSAALDGVHAMIETLTNVLIHVEDVPLAVFTLTGTLKSRVDGLRIDSKYMRVDGRASLGNTLGIALEKAVSL